MAELYHYGVLGMKWGVRKEYKPVGRKNSSPTIKPGTTRIIGNSKITIPDQTDINLRLKLNDKVRELNPGYYMSTEEAEYKLKSLTRANMHLTDMQQRLATNHNSPLREPQRSTNCFECTLAYEMRLRGYVCQGDSDSFSCFFEVDLNTRYPRIFMKEYASAINAIVVVPTVARTMVVC